ncbi:unnamed protein product [Malus baccata var. baccata]
MDEEMVEFVREAFEGGEIDMDYEFDAPKFYDFTRPETGREAEEAEEWLRSSGGYQPSLYEVVSYCHVLWCFNTIRTPYSHGSRYSNTKPKSPGKSPPLSRSSTLMKPTASQLAKQNHCREVHSNRLLRRMAKKLRKLDEKSQNSPPPMKRQKLEAGCVRKVAEQLKHQPLWLHKVGADAARPKVTVLKEPNLETANRAQRRLPNELITLIFRAPPWPSPKKSTIPATEFQELKFAIDKRCLKEPPADSFSKFEMNLQVDFCLGIMKRENLQISMHTIQPGGHEHGLYSAKTKAKILPNGSVHLKEIKFGPSSIT